MPVQTVAIKKDSAELSSTRKPIELRKQKVSLVPLVMVAIIICAGIIFAKILPAPSEFWLITAIVCTAGALCCFMKSHLNYLTIVLVSLAIFFVSSTRFAISHQTINDQTISHAASYKPSLATVRGTITSFSQMVQPNVFMGYKAKPSLKFLLEVSHFKTQKGWQKTSGLLRVSITDCFQKFNPGDKVEIAGTLGKFKKPANPGQFDSHAYAKQTGIWAYLKAPNNSAISKLKTNSDSTFFSALSKLRWKFKSYTREHLVGSGQLENGHIVDALILGNRKQSLQSLNCTMQKAGIAHFLSISGLHLGIFLGFMFLICRLFGLAKNTSCWVVLILLGLYLIIAESRAPILRSAIMATSILIGTISGRRVSALNALSLAFIVLAMFDPLAIFNAGFQMSFLIVAGIITLYQPMRNLLFGKFIRNRGLIIFRTDQRLKRWVYFGLSNWLISFVTVSLVAYLIAAPLAAFHFGTISPYAVLLSMIFMPLICAILITGYLSLGLVFIAPGISSIFASWSSKLAGMLASTTESLNSLPALAIKLQPIHWTSVVLFFLLILLVVKWKIKTPVAKTCSVSILILLSVSIFLSQLTSKPGNQAKLDLLSVGAGQCAILQSPAGNTFLFDAGSRTGFDLHTNIISKFFRNKRLPSPAAIFISHANSDHFSAVKPMLKAGFCNVFYTSHLLGKKPKQYSLESKLMNLFYKSNSQVNKLYAGDCINLDKFTKVEVIWPPKSFSSKKRNQTSLVYRVSCCGKSILFTGDIDPKIQSKLIKNHSDKLAADILVWPRHGCKDKSIPKFIETVNPKVLLVSSNRDPLNTASKTPSDSEFYKSIRRNYRYFCTANTGWVGLEITPATITTKTMH